MIPAIILAGGLGTRLRSVVNDVPKCMAPVAQKPFLHHIIEQLLKQGVEEFIFSVGYLSSVIIDYLKEKYPTLNYKICKEQEPLGTGGAIQLACASVNHSQVFIVNGDTFFDVNLNSILQNHLSKNAACSLALKPMQNFNRYGVVELNKDNTIVSFSEKKQYENGLINGGIYLLNIANFQSLNLPKKFSFEKDYLEKYYNSQIMVGSIQDKYFIDIGIPQDYEKANIEMKSFY